MAVAQLREAIIAGLEQTFPAKMGLEELVFGNAMETTFDTETIQIDKFEGTRGAAKYTARGAKGQTVGLEGWSTVSVTPPMIDENFVITAQDLKTRDYGKSNINAPIGQKFQNIVNKQLMRLKDRKQRTYNENQIVGLLTTGKVTIIEYDDKGTAKPTRYEDFLMPAAHIYTVGTAWNAVGANIFGDMRAIDALIAKNSGLTTTDAIVGETTLADMMADTTIQALLDNRRINFGEIAMEDKGNGLTYWGVLLGKRIWTFTEFDASGNPLIPTSSYIPFSNQAETDIYYASIDAMVDKIPTVVEGKEVIYNKTDDNAVAVKQGFKSAKLYALTQSAGFGHITTR
jgi:hypothetical protein